MAQKLIIDKNLTFEENIENNMSGYDDMKFQAWASYKIAEALGLNLIYPYFRNTIFGTKMGYFEFYDPDEKEIYYKEVDFN